MLASVPKAKPTHQHWWLVKMILISCSLEIQFGSLYNGVFTTESVAACTSDNIRRKSA
jgi:hypothetical protein